MAGFRIGRGRDNRTQQQQPQQAPPPPYRGGGGRAAGPYGQQQQPPQWPQAGSGHQQQHPQGPYGEPEYFGDPYQQQPPHADPYANNPGHTQAFGINEDPYGDGATYRAGAAPTAPTGPRLHWKQLLSGIVLRPGPTFWQMRDYPVWGPALIVTFLYGLLALFGFDKAREETINATISTAIPYVLTTAVAFVIGGLILGAVTHTLARQLGGDGAWQPTVALSMLIVSITDAPRLVFALFLGGENSLVQLLGWATWLAAGALFTSMVSKSHDLPWPKALGASAIQLIALLSIIKLGTI
ncbi:Yip1-like protein [Streptomyces sp. SLBN-118]|uniref:Yip1 family protein n=1 Tax=Streptomyces sp. SLBN-118 TaxID=2768454 RepID=UPI0011523505|nr:Yip1 family protein [Streptomyces sp. SLBN-118]TQK52910.1 Yip1-like protein [Streptomyces sp. SLBN-118]